MNLLPKFLSAVGAAALLAFSSGASAAPVLFNITAAQFVTELGYGLDRDESHPNLLDVRFSTNAFVAQNFTLNSVGQSFLFNFGTIDMQEPNAQGAISGPEELNDLGISAKLTFAAPTGVGVQTVTVTGLAIPGSVSDSAVDFIIDWSPITVNFAGGSFRISLTDMVFSSMGSQTQSATITLLTVTEGGGGGPSNVPEPASIALLGMGIGCVAIARRRRAKA